MLLCLICVHDLLSSSCHVVSLLSFSFLSFSSSYLLLLFFFYWLHVCAKEIIYIMVAVSMCPLKG